MPYNPWQVEGLLSPLAGEASSSLEVVSLAGTAGASLTRRFTLYSVLHTYVLYGMRELRHNHGPRYNHLSKRYAAPPPPPRCKLLMPASFSSLLVLRATPS